MIAFLHGELVFVELDSVVLDVGGVGYRVLTPQVTMGRLPSLGERVKLYTRLIVREDDMYIYGFITPEELSVFLLLTSVNGIGPKAAAGILSTFTPGVFRAAVLEENVGILSQAPRIGKKTARRIILELKDRLGAIEFSDQQPTKGDVSGFNASSEAVHALIGLGYTQVQARGAINSVLEKNGQDLELRDLIKAGLKLLDHV